MSTALLTSSVASECGQSIDWDFPDRPLLVNSQSFDWLEDDQWIDLPPKPGDAGVGPDAYRKLDRFDLSDFSPNVESATMMAIVEELVTLPDVCEITPGAEKRRALLEAAGRIFPHLVERLNRFIDISVIPRMITLG